MPEKQKLKPCPLCGGKAVIHVGQLAVDPAPMYYTIFCTSCNLKLIRSGYMADKELIETWNTRHEPTCRWEHTNHCTWTCSNCGVETEVLYQYWLHCPVCGARVVD